MKERVLVTGATGFVGRNLVKRLVKLGYNVRGIVRNKKNIDKIKNSNVEFIFGDITKKNPIKNCMNNIDIIFHLAVMVSVSECLKYPVKAFNINTLGTLNLLEEVRKDAIKTGREILFIYLSSDRVYGKSSRKIVDEDATPFPSEPYSVSKLNSELLIRCYNASYNNPSYIILRSANIYGHGQSENFFIPSLISQLLKGRNELKIGNTNQYRNFIYIDDLMDALIFVMQNKDKCKNQVFNVAESSVKLTRILNLIRRFSSKHLNRRVKFEKAAQLERPKHVEPERFILDCSRIIKLGWKPKTKFDKGLKKILGMYFQ